MSQRPSFYWPPPYRVSDWFSAEEIEASRQNSSETGSFGTPESLRELTDSSLFDLVAKFSLTEVKLYLDEAVTDMNAYVGRVADKDAVVLGKGLLEAPAAIRDWFVAHELAHIELRHSRVRGRLRLAFIVLSILLSVSLWTMGGSGAWQIPLYVGLASIVSSCALALWFFRSRSMERQADWLASTRVDRPDIRDFKSMYLLGSAELNPSRLTRLAYRHPPPAERLEFLSRL